MPARNATHSVAGGKQERVSIEEIQSFLDEKIN
jgi:hypothetical protein